MADFLTPDEVVTRGLQFLNLDYNNKWTKERHIKKFRKHYGPSPLTIASQWYDLCHTTVEDAKLTDKEKTRGFNMFLCVHYFLWHYPRNADTLAGAFGICERYVQGKNLWVWVLRIARLEKKVIFWPPCLDDMDTEINAISIDGVDKKTWERKHKELPYDPRNYTQKHAHGGIKYQIVLCAQRQQVVDIYGPVRGGMGDKEMLERSKILERLKQGKLANVDRGYICEKWSTQLSWPNIQDDKDVHNFKSRIRLRHESFNGRMAFWACMHHTWRHSIEQHGLAFRAVAVTVQYEMRNGSPLFIA